MPKVNYRLYRKLEEVLHPSISRQNISSYKIVFQQDLLPVGVFYPKKEVPLKRMIIYITDKKSNIGQDLALYTSNLVFVLEKTKGDFFNQSYEVIKYLYHQMESLNISRDDITMMSDENTNILDKIISKAKKTKDFSSNKKIYCGDNAKITMNKNRLYLPLIDSKYSFYNEKQMYEIINEFLIQV